MIDKKRMNTPTVRTKQWYIVMQKIVENTSQTQWKHTIHQDSKIWGYPSSVLERVTEGRIGR